MIPYITKEDKNSFGNFSDRKNNYDDDLEISKFIEFAKNFYNEEYQFRAKPFGDYDVDIGIYKENV